MRIKDFFLYFVKYKPKPEKASNGIYTYGVHFNETSVS
jgi:hypothetical protein